MLLSKRGSKVVRGYVVCRGLFWHTHKILIQMFRRDPKRQVHPCYSAPMLQSTHATVHVMEGQVQLPLVCAMLQCM